MLLFPYLRCPSIGSRSAPESKIILITLSTLTCRLATMAWCNKVIWRLAVSTSRIPRAQYKYSMIEKHSSPYSVIAYSSAFLSSRHVMRAFAPALIRRRTHVNDFISIALKRGVLSCESFRSSLIPLTSRSILVARKSDHEAAKWRAVRPNLSCMLIFFLLDFFFK